MIAARHDLHHMALLLLNEGADVNAKDNNGNTALHYACAYNQARVSVLLEARGADVVRCHCDGRLCGPTYAPKLGFDTRVAQL